MYYPKRQKNKNKKKKAAVVIPEQLINVQIVFFLYAAVREESSCSVCGALASAKVR